MIESLRIILFILIVRGNAQYSSEANEITESDETSNYCSDYVECAAVSLLEERLCLGNSVWRPFWLPQRNDEHKCHDKLKNDYIHLERLEEEQDGQLNACLSENSKPLDKETSQQCSLIGRTSKFSYGRSITYVPYQCFTGLKRRIERQCGQLAKCCPALEKCQLLNVDSTIQKMINTTRTNLKKRAKDCEIGLKMDPLVLERGIGFSEDEERTGSVLDSWAGPKGNVTVRFHEASGSSLAKGRPSSGHVNVRFHTEQEAIANKILIREGDQPRLSYPQRWEQFEKKFGQAAKNTQSIKDKLEHWDRNKIAKEGFDSLVDAAAVSEVVNFLPPMGTVTPHVEESHDSDNLILDKNNVVTFTETSAVTSSPVIFLDTPKTSCRPSKTFQFAKILKELGENPKSQEMREIIELVKRFENRVLNKDQEKKARIIEKSLAHLIDHFDTENFAVVKKDAEKMIDESEKLPICEMAESIDEPETTMLVDDNGDKFIIHNKDSTAKLLVGEPVEEGEFSNSTTPESVQNFISEEYKKEIAEFKKELSLWSRNTTQARRNDTTCDLYMKCRSQMHMAVDSCAWRFASDKLLSTMAESAESLLYKDDGICSQKNGGDFANLYESIIRRNDKLRTCLDEKNEKFFSESVCLAYSEEKRHDYDKAMRRLLNDSFEYEKSRKCFEDANLIQEKSKEQASGVSLFSLLRRTTRTVNVRQFKCENAQFASFLMIGNYSYFHCRESTFEADVERTIINLTAKINDLKQDCVRTKAKEAVKLAVRQLLLSTKAGQRLGQLGLDISRGARIVRMARYRV